MDMDNNGNNSNHDNNDGKKEKGKVMAYITGKGFYTIIGICLAVVIAVAWIVSGNVGNQNPGVVDTSSAAYSFPVASSFSYESGLSSELFGSSSVASQAASTPAGNTSEETAPTGASAASEAVTEPKMVFVLPCNGEVIREHSGGLPVYSPTFSDWRIHNGVDIAGAVGTPVRAMAAGVVTNVESDLIWGTRITITHDDGYVSTYSNLGAKPTVNKDSVVECGQVIGSIGTTAKAEIADEPHLHFTLTKDGESVDPMVVISTMSEE